MKVEWIKVPGRPLSAQATRKKDHIKLLQARARQQFSRPWGMPLSLQIFYVMDRRAGHTPDLDNLDKLVLDALKSIVYLDDGQIRSRKSERLYCGKPVVSNANIMPPASELQKTTQLKKEECTFIGVTDSLI